MAPLKEQSALIKKWYRPANAARYLDMKMDMFNRLIKPRIPQIQLGERAVAYDVDDLDAIAIWYKEQHSQPALLPIVSHHGKKITLKPHQSLDKKLNQLLEASP